MYPRYTNNCRSWIHLVSPWSLIMLLQWKCVPWIHKLLLILDTLRCSLVLSYGIALEMCTLDTQTVVDPKYTSFSPGLSLLYNLGDVYPGYTICCRSYIHFVAPWSAPGPSLWNYLGDVYPGYTNCCRS